MAQDYEVLQFKKGDFKDDFGNTWCNMALRGVGEPVSIAVKDPMEFHDGMTLYGELETKLSRANKEYLKFKRLKREDDAEQGSLVEANRPAIQKKEWQPRDDDAIRAQWAIGQAKDWTLGNDGDFETIEAHALKFFAMVDRIKDSDPKVDAPTLAEKYEAVKAQKKATEDADRLRNIGQEDIVHDVPDDEPIDLDKIPF